MVRSCGPQPSSQLINQKRSKHLRLPNTLVTPVDFRVRPLFEGAQDLPNLTGLYLVSLAYVFLETGEDKICREKCARQNHLVILKRKEHGIED